MGVAHVKCLSRTAAGCAFESMGPTRCSLKACQMCPGACRQAVFASGKFQVVALTVANTIHPCLLLCLFGGSAPSLFVSQARQRPPHQHLNCVLALAAVDELPALHDLATVAAAAASAGSG